MLRNRGKSDRCAEAEAKETRGMDRSTPCKVAVRLHSTPPGRAAGLACAILPLVRAMNATVADQGLAKVPVPGRGGRALS